MKRTLSEQDLYYLRSIERQLREVADHVEGLTLGSEVLYDNLNWLDCFIDRMTPPKHEVAA